MCLLVTKVLLKSLQCNCLLPKCSLKACTVICLLPKCLLKASHMRARSPVYITNVSPFCHQTSPCLSTKFPSTYSSSYTFYVIATFTNERPLEYMSPKCPHFVTKHPHKISQYILVFIHFLIATEVNKLS